MNRNQKNESAKQTHSTATSSTKKSSHLLAEFLIGLVLLCGGFYWALNAYLPSFTWNFLWSGRGIYTPIATGLLLVPLLLGMSMMFFMDRKWIGWVVIAIDALAILVTLAITIQFQSVQPSAESPWKDVVMFGMIVVGCGLITWTLFKQK